MAGWGRDAGVATRFGAIPDANDLTVIAARADPQSAMALRLTEPAAR